MDETENQLVAMGDQNQYSDFLKRNPSVGSSPITPVAGGAMMPSIPTGEQQRRSGVPSLEQQFISPAMPEEWGGRPKGTSRRARRMQAEWDEEQKNIIARQQSLQQMRDADQRFEFNQRDQMIQEETYGFAREASIAEQKLKAQQASEAKQFIASINDLDPRSPDFYDNLIKLRRQFPLGATDPTVSGIVGDYEKVNTLYTSSQKETQEQQKTEAENQAKIQADIITYGITPEEQAKMLKPNLPAGVVAFDPNEAQKVIAGAKLRQSTEKEAATEEKATKKERDNLYKDYLKSRAEFNEISKSVKSGSLAASELEKARAKMASAAAIMELPQIESEGDFKNYKSGDLVLAPDGMTVVEVP